MDEISAKSIENTSYFVRYLLSASFFSSAYYMYDAPHWISNSFGMCIYRMRNPWFSLSPEKFKDSYYFDIGFFFAFSMTIFAIGSFFSTIAPVISVICCMFFGIKYWVDKYNFVYCYKTNPYKANYCFHKNVPIIAAVNVFISKLFIFAIIRAEFTKALIKDC